MNADCRLTAAQSRVLQIIGTRNGFAWPRDLEEAFPGYRRPLNVLVKKGRVLVREHQGFTKYFLVD